MRLSNAYRSEQKKAYRHIAHNAHKHFLQGMKIKYMFIMLLIYQDRVVGSNPGCSKSTELLKSSSVELISTRQCTGHSHNGVIVFGNDTNLVIPI